MEIENNKMSSRAQRASHKGRIPFLVKFGYGGFGGSERVVEGAYYAFFLFFLTDIIGLSPTTAGTIMLVGSASDGVSDLFAGVVSDRLQTRWGRRRPILLAVALPYGLASWMLFTDFGLTGQTRILYFCAIVAVFYSISDFIVIPGKALGAEMSLDYDERTAINGFRVFWSYAGNAAGTASALLLASSFTSYIGDPKGGWSAMGACLGLAAVFPILLTWRVTRGYELRPEGRPPLSLRDIWSPLVGNRVFRHVLAFTTLTASGLYFLNAGMVYYLTYWMRYDERMSSLTYSVLGICAIAWVPLLTRFAQKLGKRHGAVFTCGFSLLGLLGLWVVQPGQHIFLIITATVAMSLLGNAYALLGGAMIADAVEVDEFKTGQRREGYHYAIAAVSYKLAISVVFWTTGATLDWLGYEPGVEQSTGVLTGIRFLMSAAPAVLVTLAIFTAMRSLMTRDRHAALLTALERKRRGEDQDVKPIRELLA